MTIPTYVWFPSEKLTKTQKAEAVRWLRQAETKELLEAMKLRHLYKYGTFLFRKKSPWLR